MGRLRRENWEKLRRVRGSIFRVTGLLTKGISNTEYRISKGIMKETNNKF
jgi:hypothetical protein